MPVEVCTVSGFNKVEGNSVAIKIDEEVIILDMGLCMENYILYTEDLEDVNKKSYEELLQVGAIPNYNLISEWKEKVIAIVPSHGHLDHVGAIPFSAQLFPKALILCTPYTAEILKEILHDEQINISNRIMPVNLNSSYKISEKITIEFINVTHSIPQSSIVCVHTPYGKILYANDYKIDPQPTLGKKTNLKRLKEIGEEGVLLLIIECLYVQEQRKMPSESVARQMLEDVMLGVHSEGRGITITTFSSHIARLKSIIQLGKKLNRKIVFLGRSLTKYVSAAERLNLVNFTSEVQLIRHSDKIKKILQKIEREGKEKYLLVCTGHQGEPKSILTKIARGDLPFIFDKGDLIVFSCSVIPVELNKRQREELEQLLRKKNVRIFKDVHVSGHAAREDHRDLIELVKPKNIIPSHSGEDKAKLMDELAKQLGFKSVYLMENGKRLKIKS